MKKVLFLFSQLNDQDIEWMSMVGRSRRFQPHEIVIEKGVHLRSIFIVLEGRLSIWVGQRKPIEIAQLGCGEVLGEMSFLEARPPSATVQAIEHSLMFEISKQELQHRLEQDFAFAARFYRALSLFLASRLRKTVGQMGYGESLSIAEEMGDEDELELDILDHLHLAGARFDRLLQQAT